MKVKIYLLDKSLPLPEYQTKGAVAFDIYAREETIINPREVKLVPTNLIITTPPGYMLMLAARSSTPLKKGLIMMNGVGVIDQDYCGPTDEIKIQLYNITNESVTINRGERIAQGIFVKIELADWQNFSPAGIANRGGFGSSD